MNNKSPRPAKKPFFARYLEAQAGPSEATTKFPSDSDEMFGQHLPAADLKLPSDQ